MSKLTEMYYLLISFDGVEEIIILNMKVLVGQ